MNALLERCRVAVEVYEILDKIKDVEFEFRHF